MAETIYGMAEYGSQWYKGAPDEAKYSRLQDLVAACGDADGDDAKNIGEFYALGDAETANAARAAYVAAVLDDGTTADGGDPEGVCVEGGGPSGYAWGETLFYNTGQTAGVCIGSMKAEMPWFCGAGTSRKTSPLATRRSPLSATWRP